MFLHPVLENYHPYLVFLQPYLESEHTILEISYPISISKKNKPAAQEKHICSLLHQPQNQRLQKSFSLSSFPLRQKKNKFSSPTPAYFKTKLIKALHITSYC